MTTPFTDTRLNLEILAEECAEVAQIKSKIIRFGLDDFHPKNEVHNRQALEREIGHLLCLVDILTETGVISEAGVLAGKEHKLEKMAEWYKPIPGLEYAPMLLRGLTKVTPGCTVDPDELFSDVIPLGRHRTRPTGQGVRALIPEHPYPHIDPDAAISKRGMDWLHFSRQVLAHIEGYTVLQYGDKGADQASDWTPEMLLEQSKKYANRFGRNARDGQQQLDLLKSAHYVQMTATKLAEKELSNAID